MSEYSEMLAEIIDLRKQIKEQTEELEELRIYHALHSGELAAALAGDEKVLDPDGMTIEMVGVDVLNGA